MKKGQKNAFKKRTLNAMTVEMTSKARAHTGEIEILIQYNRGMKETAPLVHTRVHLRRLRTRKL